MTLEQALEIAMEELYDAVEDLRYNNKGYQKHIEGQCNRLLTARNAIHKHLEDIQSQELPHYTNKEIADEKVGKWLSAALEDPSVCGEMKDDINEWFAAIEEERLRTKKKQIHDELYDAVKMEMFKASSKLEGIDYEEEVLCKTHPDAPHGFLRNESLTQNRYVCECEYWEPEDEDS